MATEDNKDNIVELKPGEVVVDQNVLTSILEKQAEMEKTIADQDAKNKGLEEMFSEIKGADTTGEKKLRERKNSEPQFHTVKIRKYPIAGDINNLGYVIGWTNRGAYPKIDKTGIAPQKVDWIDILFLGKERNADGQLVAESVPLLDLLNNGTPVHCKILETRDYKGNPFKPHYPRTTDEPSERKVETGEEIRITVYDEKHGMMETSEIIDGYVGYTDMSFLLQIPGVPEPVLVDSKYVN